MNINPKVNFQYIIDNYKGYNADYSATTQQPLITQLQTVQNNNDPLHIVVGNPGLHPSYAHQIKFGYHSLKALYFTLRAVLGVTVNSISTKTFTDTLGRQVSQAVNTNGAHNVSLNLILNKNIKSIDLNLGANCNMTYGRIVNYINQYLNRNDNYNLGGGIGLSRFLPDKYNFQISSNFAYIYSRSSINTITTDYWTQMHNAQATVFLLRNFEINTTVFYNWRQKLDPSDKKNASVWWNASIGRNFFKGQLSIRWQANDILAQSTGLSRTASANQVSESTFNVMGRYWMFNAAWRIMHHRKTK